MSVKQPSVRKQQSLNASDDPSVDVSLTLLPERRSTVTLPHSESSHRSNPLQTSPLKIFTQAKESISFIFTRIHEQLEEVKSLLASAPGVEQKARHKSDEVCGLLKRANGIKSVLARNHMKVAFFGRTSNGKSTVINALLHDKVLPSAIGHTTNCFCSVVGCHKEEGHLFSPGSSQPQNVKDVQQLAHAVYKEESSDASELIQIHWPMSRCALLKNDIVLIDSPGIDMNPNIDEWIDRHCTDADVFILVSNAESTLMNTEKRFFHHVSEKLSKPNIFILNNRWDASAREPPEVMEQIHKQHLERAITFLAKELGVIDRDVAKDRVFFISAKEALQLRMKESKSQSPIPDEVMAKGYQSRFLEFQHFESKFKACLSSSAIQTKFEQHYKRATDIINQIEVLLTEVEQECADKCQQLNVYLQRLHEREQKHNNAQQIEEHSRNVVSGMEKAVKRKVTMILDDVTSQLSDLVDRCNANFDQHNVSVYKESLYDVVDNKIIEEIRQKCSQALQELHNNGLQSITDGFQKVLQLPEKKDLTNCDQLCKNFNENLSFHSLLSLSSILKLAQSTVDICGSVSKFLPLIGIAGSLLVLARYVSWPVIGTGVLCYGLLYCWERLQWTDGAQRRCFNQQFIKHLQSELRKQISVTGHIHTRIIENNLTNHIDRFSQEVESAQLKVGERIRNLTQENKELLELCKRVCELRNTFELLQSNLSEFQAAYLMDQKLD